MTEMKRRTFGSCRIGRIALLAACAVWLFAGSVGPGAVASEEALPSAADVLDGYVEATGGKAAYERIDNRVSSATLELKAQGIELELTIYAARPNKVYTVIESEATGTIEKGTDGTTAWEKSAMMGPQIKEGPEKADLVREAIFDKLVRWRDIYASAECVGVERVSGKPAYKVTLTPTEGTPQTHYFDVSSKLLVRVDLTVVNPMGSIPVETFLEDYRAVDGVLLPHRSRIAVMGQERILTVESIAHNVDLPADRFDLPAEIRALVKDPEGQSAASDRG